MPRRGRGRQAFPMVPAPVGRQRGRRGETGRREAQNGRGFRRGTRGWPVRARGGRGKACRFRAKARGSRKKACRFRPERAVGGGKRTGLDEKRAVFGQKRAGLDESVADQEANRAPGRPISPSPRRRELEDEEYSCDAGSIFPLVPRSQVALGNALACEVVLSLVFPRSQVALGNALACEVVLRHAPGRGSVTSRTRAFPSATWERGKRGHGETSKNPASFRRRPRLPC